MPPFTPRQLWSLVLGFPLACGAAKGDLYEAPAGNARDSDLLAGLAGATPRSTGAGTLAFPGAGTSGAAQPLTVGLGPETSSACDPEPVASTSSGSGVQTVCFFTADASDVPAATVEQSLEVVGTAEWVHIRLTLNPDFADNTYGENAVGWGDADAAPTPPAGSAPPGATDDTGPGARRPPREASDAGAAPPDAPEPRHDSPEAPDAAPPPAPPRGHLGAAPPPPPPGGDPATAPAPALLPGPQPTPPGGPGGPPRAGGPGHGHTFRDLVESDHAEIELLDAGGNIVVHFKLDYLSASTSAPSGYASLGVSGGEGQLLSGDPSWILASTTSMDRNLDACGLGSFLTDSPETDADYTPNPSASDWDFRVSYEVWVSRAAFGSAGFGSALIESVHASPSKAGGATLDVVPAPCPVDPSDPNAVPVPVPAALTIR